MKVLNAKPSTMSQLGEYARYHQDDTNELIHKICVPLILATILMFLDYIQISFAPTGAGSAISPEIFGAPLSFGHVIFVGLTIYYLSLNLKLGAMMALYILSFPIGSVLPWQGAVGLFILCWIGQFVGHGVFEKKSPAFTTTPWQLIIGPIYVMAVTLGFEVPVPSAEKPNTQPAAG